MGFAAAAVVIDWWYTTICACVLSAVWGTCIHIIWMYRRA
jgi:hypothetical protein